MKRSLPCHTSACSADGAGIGGDSGPELSALLGDGTGDTGTLHLSLGVDNNTSIVLEVEEVTLSPADSLALTNNDGLEDLLPQLGLTLLHGGQEHVSDRASGVSVETSSKASNSNHVQVLGSGVVGAVHGGCDWQTVRNLQLDSVTSSSSYQQRTTHS